MILTMLKMVAIITLIIALCAWVSYWIVRRIKSNATTLHPSGYILTHPFKAPVAFSALPDAMYFVQRSSHSGIFWDVYNIQHGKLVLLGCSQNTSIKQLANNQPPQFPADEWWLEGKGKIS